MMQENTSKTISENTLENTHPLITIGITCYNAQESIERAIQSAIDQKWPNKELVIVDDCSSDESVSIIEGLAQNAQNIRLVKHEGNGGPAKARQTILDNANGECIVFFDDDDESLPERLTLQYQRIVDYEQKSGTNKIACYASGKRLYPNDYTVNLQAIGSQGAQIPAGTIVANRLLFYGDVGEAFFGTGTPTCSLMIRAQTLKEIGGFDPDFRRVEDVDMAVRLALKGGHFIGTPEQLFVQHATNAPDKAPEKNLEAELRLVDKHRTYLHSVGMYYYAKNWPYLRFYHFKRQYGKMLGVLFRLVLRYPLKTLSHFCKTGSRRMIHELKMRG